MGEVLTLPIVEDIEVIKTAISVFLRTRNALTRNTMHEVIRHIMGRYRIKHMSLEDIRLTVMPSGSIRFEAKKIIDGISCPVCQEIIHRAGSKVTIVCVTSERGHNHLVCYGCGGCNSIFGKWEENE